MTVRRRAFLSGAGALGATAAAAGLPGWTSAGRERRAPFAPRCALVVPRAVDFAVDAAGETAYVTTHRGFVVVDVSDPAAPEPLAVHRSVLADHEQGPVVQVRDASVDGDRLLLTAHSWAGDPQEHLYGAAVLFDVSDPASPDRVAHRRTDYPVHNGSLEGDVAAVTGTLTDRWPMVVLDAGDGLAELGRWSVVDGDERWADVDPSIRRLHDVHLRDGTAYLSYWDAGAWTVDLTDPAAPEPTGQFGGRDPDDVAATDQPAVVQTTEGPGNATATLPNDDGSLLAVSKEASDDTGTDHVGGPGGVHVWRTDAGERAVRLRAPRVPGPSWSKNFGWRGDRLYVAFRRGGVRAYDLADPAEPTLLAAWRNPGPPADFHTARPLAEGFAGLTSFGGPDAARPTRLYTFPEPTGEDGRPAPTGTPVPEHETPSGTATPEGWPTTPSCTSVVTSAPEGTREGRAGTASATPTGDGTGSATGTATTVPGFGALATGAAGALAAWRLARRRG